VYRPLSLLALGAFVVAVVYALVLLVSTVFAFFFGQPLLIPPWVLLVPLAAAVIAWGARRQIQASEGTLGGMTLASWAIGLSLVLALVYTAYYFGTYVAIEQQARAIAEEYLDWLKKGEIEKAFRLSIPLSSRPPLGDKLREDLEMEFGEPRRGFYSIGQFRQLDTVRLVTGGGPQTESYPVSVVEWDHNTKDGGYKITLRYHLKNAVSEFDMRLTALGTDPKEGDEGRRQWRILPGESGYIRESEKLTKEGERRRVCAHFSRVFTDKWINDALTAHKMDEAWKGTLVPEDRETADQLLDRAGPVMALPITGPGVLASYDAAQRDLLMSWLAFRAGGVVRAREGVFFANAQQKPEVIRAVRGLFASGAGRRYGRSAPGKSAVPNWAEADGKVRIVQDVQLVISNVMMTQPEWTVDAQIVTEAPATAGAKANDWRVVAVDLITARSGGPPGPPGGGPGGPGGF
jgi:hypothetical protein